MLIDQSSWDVTLVGVWPPRPGSREAVSSQSSRDKHPKLSLEPISRGEGRAISTKAELALFRALKAPAAAAALPDLAKRARDGSWSYERFAEELLSTEQLARSAHGGEARIRAARFPGRKSLDEFDFSFQKSVSRQVLLHLSQLDFLAECGNVVFLGPPGTGKTHLSIALGIRACLSGHRVAFATATEWVARLADAHRQGRLEAELRRLQRIPLVVVDEIGYIVRPRGRQRHVHAGVLALRAGLGNRDVEQAVLRVGGDLRGRRGSRGHGRPAGSPRRGDLATGRQLPAEGPGPGKGGEAYG